MAEISIIVVNYGTADLAIGAVESVLARQHGGRSIDVHLVDNASPGSDAVRLQEAAEELGWAGRVTLHLETRNHGFGQGNNLVLERLASRDAPPEKVFLLNPDARLKNEAIAILADFLDRHSQVGFAGARIEQPGGAPAVSAFRFPSLISEFSAGLSFGPVARLCERWQVPLGADLPTSPADWVSGAAVMARFATLRQIGFFDPAYFLYFEEVDLMRRGRLAGWQTWHVSEAEVVHAEGTSTGVKSGERVPRRRPAYWYHSWQHYFSKNHGRGYALAASGARITGGVLNRGISWVRGRQSATSPYMVRDFWSVAGRQLVGLKARTYE